jgi:replication-associated recombination protein RarA
MYLAHALQRPKEKPGVMIILLGGQGTGKGTFGRICQKIWSATYVQVNNIDKVTGNFNAILERAFFVFMDEALFFGNHRGSDELKSLVTEQTILISEKYQPSRQIVSCHRFIPATNADNFKILIETIGVISL